MQLRLQFLKIKLLQKMIKFWNMNTNIYVLIIEIEV